MNGITSCRSIVVLIALLSLTACGGGGGGGGGAPAPQPTNLDPSFGANGKVVTEFFVSNDASSGQAMAIQDDGKIVVAGYAFHGSNDEFALARYNADGSLDTGFGFDNTGTVTTGFFSGEDDQISAIALQTDGKIVAAGWASDGSNDNFALARYLP